MALDLDICLGFLLSLFVLLFLFFDFLRFKILVIIFDIRLFFFFMEIFILFMLVYVLEVVLFIGVFCVLFVLL